MALSLTAEQKNISSLFYNEDQYIIPEFQRPYCWTFDTSYQLYTDIMTYSKTEEDFFVGNIVMARSDDHPNSPQVVDGQQRIITLWLWMKSLMLLVPSLGKLQEGVGLKTWEEDTDYVPKVKSNVVDSADSEQLDKIWRLDLKGVEELLEDRRKLKDSRVLSNFLDIFSWLKSSFAAVGEEDKRRFVKYFIYKVYLLPIELKGKTEDEANERALMIFETINNRGQNLEDADIFKAKLYNKAVSVGKKQDFLYRWIGIKDMCLVLEISIEDLFKYYSHIIRGSKGVTTFEVSLRDFFTKGSNAPIIIADYEQVTDELVHILEVLKMIDDDAREKSDLGMWLNILKMYSNNFPMFAVASYLYINGKDNGYVNFLKLLTRICYSYGPSTTIKFTIYNVIADIFSGDIKNKNSLDYCVPNLENLHSRHFLKKGMIMLAYYLVVQKPFLGSPSIERILRLSPKSEHVDEIARNFMSQLGNFFVIEDKNELRENDYNQLYFEFKNKISKGNNLLDRIQNRTQKLMSIVFDFLSNKLEKHE